MASTIMKGLTVYDNTDHLRKANQWRLNYTVSESCRGLRLDSQSGSQSPSQPSIGWSRNACVTTLLTAAKENIWIVVFF